MADPTIRTAVEATRADAVRLRRLLHQNPEAGFQESRTCAIIEKSLARDRVPHRRVAGTGVLAEIRGRAGTGPVRLFRADMDGLPVTELNRVPYRSRIPGMMHACGHDGHVAIGLMTCRVLNRMRDRLRGTVKFMFQPAEEGPGGAKPMIDAGILKAPKVDEAYALHMWNPLPAGTIGVRAGPMFAGADEFTIRITGRGGHASAPHECVDPVPIAASLVHELIRIPTRKIDAFQTCVVTVGKIASGNRFNIIPDGAELQGTMRYYDRRVQREIQSWIRRITKHICAAHGAKCTVSFDLGYPPTINHDGAAATARNAARAVVGARRVVDPGPVLGAEDMSYVLQRVPGCYFVLGSANSRRGLDEPHHSARFDFDDSTLPYGIETFVRIALG